MIKYFILAIATLTAVLTLSINAPAMAQAPGELEQICRDRANNSALCQQYRDGKSGGNPITEILADVVNLLLFAVGALAVIMVIYAGFKYGKSGGDSNKVSEAKNTILYAIVGLVVAIIANRLIVFILNRFFN